MRSARLSVVSALAFAAVSMMGPSAHADVTSFDAIVNLGYTQTANNAAPAGPATNFFSTRIFCNKPGDISTATGTSGSHPVPFSYTPQAGDSAMFRSEFLTSSVLNSFVTPNDSLRFQIDGGNLAGTTGTGKPFGAPLFTSTVPYLTGNSYNTLQGLHVTQAVTVTFNGFSPAVGSNGSCVFISIIDKTTNAIAHSASFCDTPGITSFLLAANTLAASTSYTLEIDYSSRLESTGILGKDTGAIPFIAGYDVRTRIDFTTANAWAGSEPVTVVVTAIGVVLILRIARRRQAPIHDEHS